MNQLDLKLLFHKSPGIIYKLLEFMVDIPIFDYPFTPAGGSELINTKIHHTKQVLNPLVVFPQTNIPEGNSVYVLKIHLLPLHSFIHSFN